MLGQEYKVKIDRSLLKQGQGIVQVDMPLQTQQQAYNHIKKSELLLKSIKDKSNYLFSKQHYDSFIEEKLTPFKVSGDRFLMEKWQQQQIQAMSLYPVIANIVVSHLQNFLSIQTEIDPYTKKLVTMPNGSTPVIDFVSSLLQKNIVQCFNAIQLQFQYQLYYPQKRLLWQPILTHIMNQLSKINFLVSPMSFFAILMNANIPVLFSEEQIVKRNDKIAGLLKNSKSQEYTDQISQLMIKQVQKKRKLISKKAPRFFAKITQPTQYQKLVQTSLQSQKQSIMNSKARFMKRN